ncbi:MAG TPA: PAAR domain-containing protein [Kofleriaceae bacterium]|jgi:uncharacterized Zn-binding protein involved in type VI secretion
MPPQARVSDQSNNPADAHGCPKCPHQCTGPAMKGSPDTHVNNLPAVRVGDNGMHTACCVANTWVALKGSGTVMINNIPAHRKTDQVTHCGGVGQTIMGSPDVITGG